MAPVPIGREHPADVLRAEVDRTLTSHGGLVLVTGEAGIGKTTLVADAAEQAAGRGALVLVGTCWEQGSAPGYWPWVQVVRNLRRAVGPAAWADLAGAAGDGLAFLLGEPDARPGTSLETGLGTGPAFPDDAAAFRLHDAVTTLLVAASRIRPVVVAVEDLHWADAASIRLLEFVVGHTWFERLLVVGTYRDVEVEVAGHPLQPLLPPLVAKATTLTLTGLDRTAVGALITRTCGREVDEALLERVFRHTGGNPFFVEQTVRLWHRGGALDTIAPSIRVALQRRLADLPAPVVALLGTAAVLGRRFHRQVLAAASATPEPAVDRLLDRAVTARLVEPLGAGRFAFTHDLVRATLYASFDPADARRRHASVVRALDRVPALAAHMVAAEPARHAALAVPDIAAERAVHHLRAAARDASLRLASEEAAGHYRRALELTPERSSPQWIELAHQLGTELHRSGELADARRLFEEVVHASRDRGDAAALARAAVALHELGRPMGDRVEIELLDEAQAGIALDPAGDDALSARVLAAASMARTHRAVDHDAACALAVRAVEVARRAGNDAALGRCLLARHDAIWTPGTAVERIALLDEMTALARRSADRELESLACLLRTVALLEQGDPAALTEHEAFVAMADRTRLPRHRFLALSRQAAMATLVGRFDEARALVDDAHALAGQLGEVDGYPVWRDQSWSIARLQGRFEELDAVVRAGSDHERGEPFLRVLEVVTAVHRGDVAFALRHLAEVETIVAALPRWFGPVWLRVLAEVAAASGDAELCARARAAIAPCADGWAVVSAGVQSWGPLVFWRALVDAAEGRADDAVEGFTAARTAADRLGARPWSIEAGVQLARALAARRAPGDVSAATALLDDVEPAADELGMLDAAERARATRTTLTTPAPAAGPPEPAAPPAAPPAGNVFRFDESVWTLAFAGDTVHVPAAKGLADLHVLLGRPGTDVPAVELLDPAGGRIVVVAGRLGGDAVLDDRAKAHYRARLAVLDAEIESALDRADDRRAAEYDRERASLLAELRQATGLAGRPRRLGDQAERARQTVTARIRDTLRRLDRRHPALAEHLRASITTGTSCRYTPATPTTWTL